MKVLSFFILFLLQKKQIFLSYRSIFCDIFEFFIIKPSQNIFCEGFYLIFPYFLPNKNQILFSYQSIFCECFDFFYHIIFIEYILRQFFSYFFPLYINIIVLLIYFSAKVLTFFNMKPSQNIFSVKILTLFSPYFLRRKNIHFVLPIYFLRRFFNLFIINSS